MPAIKFRGVDFIEFDTLLNEDELLVRDTAREFVEDNLIPIIEECFREGRFPARTGAADGRAGLLRRQPRRLRLRRHVQRRIRPGDAGAGARRLRLAQLCQRAVGLVMYPIYTFGSEEQKKTWLPAMATGEKLGCFGLTEPGLRVESRRHDAPRARKVGRRIHPQRRKDVDHLRHHRRRGRHLGQGAKTKTNKVRGFLVETDRPGFTADDIHGKWSLRASVTSGLSLAGRARARGRNLLPGAGGLKGAADVPEPGALRHRLGRDWRGHGLLRRRRCNTPNSANSSTISPSPAISSCRKSWSG